MRTTDQADRPTPEEPGASLPARPEDPARLMRHPVWVAIGIAAAAGALSLGTQLLVPKYLFGEDMWWQGGDAWPGLAAALHVANGAFGFLYEASSGYVAGPLWALALAPAAAVGQELGLVPGLPKALPRPSFWPLLAGYGLMLAAVAFYAAGRLAELAGVLRRRRQLLLQLLVIPVALIPAGHIFGHYEDVLTLGIVMLVACQVRRGRHVQAAALLSVAICLKQWSLLAVPLVVMWAPRRDRLRTLVAATALPAVLVGFVLLLDWAHASRGLIFTRTWPEFGHPQLWVPPTEPGDTVPAAQFRVGSVLIALALAWRLRNRRDMPSILAGLSVVFLARIPFEAVVHAYYLSPSLMFAIFYEQASTGRVWRTSWGSVLLLMLFPLHPNPWLWWGTAIVVGTFVYWLPVSAVLRRGTPAAADASDEGDESAPGAGPARAETQEAAGLEAAATQVATDTP